MKSLQEILKNVKVKQISGTDQIPVPSIHFDSRKITDGDLFIAVKGDQTDGHLFIDKSVEKGAKTIVCEKMPQYASSGLTYVIVEDSSLALALIASNFYSHPSLKLKLIGVTGTNGKTTIATSLYHLFLKMGYKVGLLSTIKNYIHLQEIDTKLTTPDALQINSLLNDMVNEGCTACFMEVSSHSVVQNRIAGLHFSGGVFTNITHDHLDYHKTFADYIHAKKMFFDGLQADAFALINQDDPNGKKMHEHTHAKRVTYALKSQADFKCKVMESHMDGMLLSIDNRQVWTTRIGHFNAYNLLAVYACSVLMGQPTEKILPFLSELKAVSGRFEYIRSGKGIIAIVDYAHTPDAIENVLEAIRQIRTRKEMVITIIGAGGNRDKTKRPEMAKIAVRMSDKVILTADNPRNEKPEDIIHDMMQGVDNENLNKVIRIVDRKEAIKTACLLAHSGDIILVAGKGHENYQEVNGVRHPFDDKEIIKKIFSE